MEVMVAVQSWFRLIVKKVGVFLGFPGKKKFQKRSPTDKIYSNGQRIRAKETPKSPLWNIYDQKYGKYGNKPSEAFFGAFFCTFWSFFTISLLA
jgi:hypothetical protein